MLLSNQAETPDQLASERSHPIFGGEKKKFPTDPFPSSGPRNPPIEFS